MIAGVADQFIPQSIGIPTGPAQQTLNAEWLFMAEMLGHLPTILAIDRAEQSADISGRLSTQVTPREDIADAIQKRIELRFPGTNDMSIHADNSIPTQLRADDELSAKNIDALL